jgi:hypothetical protein
MKKILLFIMGLAVIMQSSSIIYGKDENPSDEPDWVDRVQSGFSYLGNPENKTNVTLICASSLVLGTWKLCAYTWQGGNPILDPFRWIKKQWTSLMGSFGWWSGKDSSRKAAINVQINQATQNN